jgi:hypothetical protein
MLATTPIGSRRMIEVWPAEVLGSPRALLHPRGTGEEAEEVDAGAISSIAAPTGLPAFWLSSCRSPPPLASSESAILSRSRLRSCGVVSFQLANAFSAALTARSTSSARSRDPGDHLAVGRVLDIDGRPAASTQPRLR